MLGRPSGYDAPKEQELKDLSDSRNRKRGEREQQRRNERRRSHQGRRGSFIG